MTLSLTGCFSEEKSVESPPAAIVPSQNGPKPDSVVYTSDDIKKMLEQQGFQVVGAGDHDDPILNYVTPENYYLHCSPSTDCKMPREHLSVFIFKSKEEQVKGIADFDKQQIHNKDNLTVVWGKTNAIVVYWYPLNEKPLDEQMLSQALVGWEKISQHNSVDDTEIATSSSCEIPPKVLEWSGQTYHLKAENSTLEPGMKFGYIKCDNGKFTLGDADNSFIVYSVGDPRSNSDILFRGQWGFALYSLDNTPGIQDQSVSYKETKQNLAFVLELNQSEIQIISKETGHQLIRKPVDARPCTADNHFETLDPAETVEDSVVFLPKEMIESSTEPATSGIYARQGIESPKLKTVNTYFSGTMVGRKSTYRSMKNGKMALFKMRNR